MILSGDQIWKHQSQIEVFMTSITVTAEESCITYLSTTRNQGVVYICSTLWYDPAIEIGHHNAPFITPFTVMQLKKKSEQNWWFESINVGTFLAPMPMPIRIQTTVRGSVETEPSGIPFYLPKGCDVRCNDYITLNYWNNWFGFKEYWARFETDWTIDGLEWSWWGSPSYWLHLWLEFIRYLTEPTKGLWQRLNSMYRQDTYHSCERQSILQCLKILEICLLGQLTSSVYVPMR